MSETQSFEALPLAAPLQRALREKNYTTPSPIQAQAIPPLLEGRDLLGSAQTGTGKTAAFALPILHQIHERPKRLIKKQFRALILCPTRELAVQVGKSFDTYGQHLRISTALVYGGVGATPQIKALRRGVDILVATPGRLLDLYEQGHFDFDGVEFFVLDEADRMLDMGFIHDIKKIIYKLPVERQSLFFSATFSKTVTDLASEILDNPAEVRIAPEKQTADAVDHRICFVDKDDKMPLLQNLLDEQKQKEGDHLTLVFSRTKHGADKLAKALGRAGHRAEAIHGNKSQGARQRALENFRRGKVGILVATDVAARGIDVKNITMVVNYDLPDEPEAYVHRIGRTARGGAEGVALSFCTSDCLNELRAVERLIKQQITTHDDHEFHQPKVESRRQTAGKPGQGKRFQRKGKGGGGFRGKSGGGGFRGKSGGGKFVKGGPRAKRNFHAKRGPASSAS
ncbi:DEAD/DEAH box helicase [Cerasicoccus frondis]|uniref:DEAD/DEAH box helicase n=1 Tax=Cerasicoccus frondis TaxID=490090 RepID=UPI0028528DBB|nr:DEAD/DEAH box helicase [Cerasicoccus frondis]